MSTISYSQKKIKDDVIITYKAFFEEEVPFIKKQEFRGYFDEKVIYFNKSKFVHKVIYQNPKASIYSVITQKDFDEQKKYVLYKYRGTNKGEGYYMPFKKPSKMARKIEGETKEIAGYECQKYEVYIKGEKKYLYTTDAFGIKYTANYDIEGQQFIMEQPMYSKRFGYYKFQADTVIIHKLEEKDYSLKDYRIFSKEEFDEHRNYIKEEAHQANEKANMELIGNKAYDFTLKTIDGQKINTKALKGKVIVYNFWFVKQKNIDKEVKKLNQLYEKYMNNTDVIFVAITIADIYKIKNFQKKYPFYYHQIDDGRYLCEKFNVKLYPTNIVVDKEGNYFNYTLGYKHDLVERLSYSIDEALQKEYISESDSDKTKKHKRKRKNKEI
ncbi:hypothetical protein AVL50_03265 [Flammeovirga sp. SJP92]|nr:hypothetical protein AVL50_03265 [Flammeovirga sp. SJP92]